MNQLCKFEKDIKRSNLHLAVQTALPREQKLEKLCYKNEENPVFFSNFGTSQGTLSAHFQAAN